MTAAYEHSAAPIVAAMLADIDRCEVAEITPTFRPDVIAQMRGWLADCYVDDLEEIEDAPARAIVRQVSAMYEGGLRAFILDGAELY